jgi:uncharacterized protein YcgL (UPF0745 family)
VIIKEENMKADIYRSKDKRNRYYFIKAGTKEEDLPDAVKKECDTQQPHKTIDLNDKNRIGVDSNEAINNISSNGYHVQEVKIEVK